VTVKFEREIILSNMSLEYHEATDKFEKTMKREIILSNMSLEYKGKVIFD
jgi:hypothetical protein